MALRASHDDYFTEEELDEEDSQSQVSDESMVPLTEFSIYLSEERVYHPGEELSGKVVLETKEEFELIGLELEFTGEVYTYWTEVIANEKREFHGQDTLFAAKRLLFGGYTHEQKGSIVHSSGKSIYEFKYTCPDILPSSFESSEGCIRYCITAYINASDDSNDHEVKVILTILDNISTADIIYQHELGGEEQKQVGCFCCCAGLLSFTSTISHGAYLPGENINVLAKATNQTYRDMSAIKAKIEQVVIYFDNNDQHHVTRKVVVKVEGPSVGRNQTVNWKPTIQIPSTAPSIFNCHLIHVKYVLHVYVDIPWTVDLDVTCPIVVGTTPFNISHDSSSTYRSVPGDDFVQVMEEDLHIRYTANMLRYRPLYPFVVSQPT
ncbi:arrestin domain-containing protein 3-like [Hydractinia symbiolongicarpus]|uniref:arrestin domain-containing protein 3-like n=1 Tax=Hydractinia symbiolongicarpus TaxID=13093 RepID=UPI00254B68CF|nr:arrestin domain-containing protein 3-like [Hydractinia symbiolongicarpus]